MELIALRSFPYAGKRLKAGDTFTARGKQDGNLLKALKHAADAPVVSVPVAAPVPVAPVKRAYVRRSFTDGGYVDVAPNSVAGVVHGGKELSKEDADAFYSGSKSPSEAFNELVGAAKPEPEEPRQKRAYRRRDMTAE